MRAFSIPFVSSHQSLNILFNKWYMTEGIALTLLKSSRLSSLAEVISALTSTVLIPAWPFVHVRRSFKGGSLLKPAGRAVQSCSCFWWCLTALIDVYFGIEFHSFHANVLHAAKWVRAALGGRSLCVPG